MRSARWLSLVGIGLAGAMVAGIGPASAADADASPSAAATPGPASPTLDPSATATPPDPDPTAPAPPTETDSSGPPVPATPEKPKARKHGREGEKTLAEIKAGSAMLGLGDTGQAVTAVQTRLNVAGLKTTISGVFTKETEKTVGRLQWKWLRPRTGRIDKKTYALLVNVTAGRFRLPRVCRTRSMPLIICIDLKQKVLRYVKRGKVGFVADIRAGAPSTPTRRGLWRIFSKQVFLISSLYGSPMPFSMFFSGGEAIHYSKYFHSDGYNGYSHGCVGVYTMAEAGWLYRRTPLGTRVLVY